MPDGVGGARYDPGMSSTSPEALAYEEGIRAVASQEATLDELRSRAALLFTAMALAISFLGQAAIADGWGFWEVTAVIDLGVVSFLIGVIVRPRAWRFSIDVKMLVTEFVDEPNRVCLTVSRLLLYRQLMRFGE